MPTVAGMAGAQVGEGGDHDVTPERFRHAMGRFATGVTVITALDDDGRLHGLTANAFSSLSLSPPLVLACVSYSSRCFPVIERARQLTIHILAADQGHIAKGFARTGSDRADVCDWHINERGFPVLAHYAIALECELQDIHPGGDHGIVVSRVLRIHADRGHDPLLYYCGELMPLPGR